MNKNLFIYSFKYLAVLLALVTFSSCERDEFTEQDAFDLRQAQLDADQARNEAALSADDKRVMNMAMFRRSMDSLARLNSGGRVFYTVNVVPGGSTAFSSGRFEEVEGLDGATVTVTQLGGSFTDRKTTVAGLASFQLYSGEVTVNVAAPNHTDLNYTANLTPDGGVRNGAAMFVGNVVPVFDDPNNPAAGSANNLATVRGFAFAELDITFGNNVEEAVPAGTKVRAFIDVAAPTFRAKYITKANDEERNIDGNVTKSGAIQRFAYEEAASTTGTTVTATLGNTAADQGGQYSISIGATASGLPVQMKFDDFAANRRYFFTDNGTDLSEGTGTKRFLYTQNTELVVPAGGGAAVASQTQTAIVNRGLFAGISTLRFNLVTTEATATAALATTGGGSVASVTVSDGGYYYVAPTVVFGAAPVGGTTATGTAVLGALPAPAVLPAVDSPELIEARSLGLRRVVSVTVAPGSGGTLYTANPSVTFTRVSYTGRDAGGVPIPNGRGSIKAPSTGVTFVQITDSGFGMTTPAAPFNTTNEYTGVRPLPVFTPDVTIAGNTAAQAVVAVDQAVGVASEVQVITSGTGYDQATVGVTFNYGIGGGISTAGQPNLVDAIPGNTPGLAIFESNGAGGIRFNDEAAGTGGPAILTPGAGREFALEQGSNYSFVPRVTLGPLPLPAGATSPTFTVTVNGAGQIASIELNGSGSGLTAAAADVELGFTITVTPFDAGIRANAFTTSGGIDNYVITNVGTPTSGIYRSTVNAINPTNTGVFEYVSFDPITQTYRNYRNGTLVTGADAFNVALPAVPSEAEFNDNSSFQVGFLTPAGGTPATGYPIFDAEGTALVGIVIKNKGTNYRVGTTLGVDNLSYWVIPNGVTLSEYAQLGENLGSDANADGTSTRTLVTSTLTITFTGQGLGYAIRPEILLSGGNKSAEDLAVINAGINTAVNRGLLNFNTAGSIIFNTPAAAPLRTTIGLPGFTAITAADIAAEPISVIVSVARLQAIYNSEVNSEIVVRNAAGVPITDNTGFNGVITPTVNATGTAYTGNYIYEAVAGSTTIADRVQTTALNFFNILEGAYVAQFFPKTPVSTTYITAPRFTVLSGLAGTTTGAVGIALLDATANIIGLSTTTLGTAPAPIPTNSLAIPLAGEPFRTIGGSSSFEVFSGLTYIRDVNYGTGIELE